MLVLGQRLWWLVTGQPLARPNKQMDMMVKRWKDHSALLELDSYIDNLVNVGLNGFRIKTEKLFLDKAAVHMSG